MRRLQILVLVACFATAGCSGQSSNEPETSPQGDASTGTAPSGPAGAAQGARDTGQAGGPMSDPAGGDGSAAQPHATIDASELTPVPIEGGVVTLSPESSSIGYVGVHTSNQPDRVGGFEKFTGKIELDPSGKTLKSISAEVETDSLWAPFGKLTNHLKSADFLEVREFPKITFQSTRIEAGEGGQARITGKLTLHGVEKEVQFPAKVTVSDDGLVLGSSFVIDRTQFGMDKVLNMVKPAVTVTVAVGKKTQPQQGGGFGPGGGGFGGRGGGGFDPGAYFDSLDKDKDGKLAGDEIPERMRQNLEQTDTDKDGAISKEEFEARMSQFGRGGGGRGGFGGRGGGGFDASAFFDNLDKDKDGKLAGDEIPEQMRANLSEIDTDKDGAVSKEEFQARMRQFRGGRGGPGGRGARGGGQSGQPGAGQSGGPQAQSSNANAP